MARDAQGRFIPGDPETRKAATRGGKESGAVRSRKIREERDKKIGKLPLEEKA